MAGGNALQSRITGLFERIQDTINNHWKTPDVAGDYFSILRQVFFTNSDFNSPKFQSTNRWALLPGLCCQAVGGKAVDADLITSAWLLYYIAAHIMDCVQDGDDMPTSWPFTHPGIALNVASGFFFTGNSLFIEAVEKNQNNSILPLILEFNHKMLVMCDGQHEDLTTNNHNLITYWHTVIKKSGTFFELACKSGASIGTTNTARVNLFADYGRHLGVLIQIFDDLEEWNKLINQKSKTEYLSISKTLPVVYALDILPIQEKAKLLDYLENFSMKPEFLERLLQIIDQSGASLYLLAEMERHKYYAQNALDCASPETEAGDLLKELLESLIQAG